MTLAEPDLGYDANFLEELDRKYVCPVCLAVLRDPVQTRCGHRFCVNCLKRCSRNQRYAKCPVDNILLDVSADVFADVATRREVLSLTVSCPSDGDECAWTGELRTLEAHTDICPNVAVPCTYGCSARRRRRSLQKHLESCPHRLDTCSHCHTHVKVVEITKHQLLTCPCFPVLCKFCGKWVLRQDVPHHTDDVIGDCPKVMVKCPFHVVGCQFQALRSSMELHNETCMVHHMLLLSARSNMQDEKLLQYEEILASQHRSSQQFCGLVNRHNRLIENERRRILTECQHTQNLHAEINNLHCLLHIGNYHSPI